MGEDVRVTHVGRGDLKERLVSCLFLATVIPKFNSRWSYLGRDQGRKTTADDVAHLVGTGRSQNFGRNQSIQCPRTQGHRQNVTYGDSRGEEEPGND